MTRPWTTLALGAVAGVAGGTGALVVAAVIVDRAFLL